MLVARTALSRVCGLNLLAEANRRPHLLVTDIHYAQNTTKWQSTIPSLSSIQYVFSKRKTADVGCLRSCFGDITKPIWHQRSQIRLRRHDRASSKSAARRPTKKQKREYNRQKKHRAEMATKHNPPGSKAGPRRQWAREQWQRLVQNPAGSTELMDPSSELTPGLYGFGDALLDDLIGNTSHLTAQPTPKPLFLGHKHQELYTQVSRTMNAYRKRRNLELQANLPSDTQISNVLRSYRDLHGKSRSLPVGIARATEHLVEDLGIPTSAFGEYTYTSLLTCCRSPKEVCPLV